MGRLGLRSRAGTRRGQTRALGVQDEARVHEFIGAMAAGASVVVELDVAESKGEQGGAWEDRELTVIARRCSARP